MKKLLYGVMLSTLIFAGCSSNPDPVTNSHIPTSAIKGASVGAVSGVFLAGMAELLITGRISPERMARAATTGAVMGGSLGIYDGYKADEDSDPRLPQPRGTFSSEQQELMRQVGPFNVNALIDLVEYRHDDAYRQATLAYEAPDKDFQKASLALRALVDMDRQNTAGAKKMSEELRRAIGSKTKINDVQKGLSNLYDELFVIRQKHSVSAPKN